MTKHTRTFKLTLYTLIIRYGMGYLLLSSYPLSRPLPFDYVEGSNGVNMGPVQLWLPHSLATATPFKSQKILFKDSALSSNLLQPKGDQVYLTFQY